ncbi:hypothetical protein FRC17_005181 [Serendipita sp. 399]|nr:hypothetical protein FRC17_005181 [Serendipita sp. 399]
MPTVPVHLLVTDENNEHTLVSNDAEKLLFGDDLQCYNGGEFMTGAPEPSGGHGSDSHISSAATASNSQNVTDSSEGNATISCKSSIEPVHSLDLFSAITIHGITHSRDGCLTAVTLNRTQTFPAKLWRGSGSSKPSIWPERGMAARPIPPPSALHLELRIKERLGEGHMGTVYSTEVVSITAADLSTNIDIPTLTSELPELCIKIASPIYCRALARDAWYYEQLDAAGLQGVTIPRSYGLFSATLNDQNLRMKEWEDKMPEWFKKYDPERDMLYDDQYGDDFVDDAKANHHSPPWHVWRAEKDDPWLIVLLLEKGGDSLKEEEYEANAQDIRTSIEDLSHAMVVHGDFWYTNLIRASRYAKTCPRHGRVHKWFFIDFELSLTGSFHILDLVRFQEDGMDEYHAGIGD